MRRLGGSVRRRDRVVLEAALEVPLGERFGGGRRNLGLVDRGGLLGVGGRLVGGRGLRGG
jgi:hypothetical protein